jgi:hypothetical protein
MMKWILGLLICSPLIFGGALWAASEYGGETVLLKTFDEREVVVTTLWVVDLHDEPWLRAVNSDATWLQRLVETPLVVLVRDGETKSYRAEIDPSELDRVNDMMREKYGWADEIVSLINDPDSDVAVRLVETDEP